MSTTSTTNSSKKLPAGQIYFDFFLLVLSLIVLLLAYRISGFGLAEAGTFPLASSAVMVLSLGMVILSNRKKERDENKFLPQMAQAVKDVCTKEFLIFCTITILYIIAVQPFHFLPSSFVFLALSIVVLKGSRPLKAVLISAGMLGFIYLVFLYFFKVILP